jgi:hypothetical protein
MSDFGHAVARVGRAHLHPRLEVRDYLIRELLLGRHRRVLVLVPQRLDEEAPVRVARDDGRSGDAALANTVAGVEQELAPHLLRLGRVALVAGVRQHRADLLLEERELLLGRLVGEPGRSGRLRGGRVTPTQDRHEGEADDGEPGHGESPPGPGGQRYVAKA